MALTKKLPFPYKYRGADTSAMVYSMIQTAMENNLNPMAYLTYLFTTLPNLDFKNTPTLLEELLQTSDTLPEFCRIKKS